MQCRNCGSELSGNYCSHCGQKTKVERISAGYFYHELIHYFTHMENGFIFTSYKMVLMPGKTVSDYIYGKRKYYQTPVSYFLIWTSIYILLLYGINLVFGENTVVAFNDYFGPGESTHYAISHLALVLTMIIPFQALFLYTLLARAKYNYFESLVITIYFLGTILLFQTVFLIFSICMYFISGHSIDLKLSDLLKLGFLSWSGYDFSKTLELKTRWLKLALFILLAFSTFTLWRIYGYPALVHYLS